MNKFIFRQIKKEDKDTVTKIYNDARCFMADSGNPEQWADGYPDECLICEDIEKERGYVCEFDGKIAAVFMFVTEDDESYRKIYDGSWKNDEPYGVIHRIAVSKEMHGKGIAKECFDFCRNECIKQGIYNLKIDTYKDNIPMQKTLAKYGFEYCGTVYIDDKLERMAYQYIINI